MIRVEGSTSRILRVERLLVESRHPDIRISDIRYRISDIGLDIGYPDTVSDIRISDIRISDIRISDIRISDIGYPDIRYPDIRISGYRIVSDMISDIFYHFYLRMRNAECGMRRMLLVECYYISDTRNLS